MQRLHVVGRRESETYNPPVTTSPTELEKIVESWNPDT